MAYGDMGSFPTKKDCSHEIPVHYAMENSRSLMLSTEEQEELSRSKKKVKNVGHAGFQEGLDIPSLSRSSASRNQIGTFKDRLVGEVLATYI